MRHDVPGAKLVHENVADHSSVQLQRWLKCRGFKNSGLKPELVKRGHWTMVMMAESYNNRLVKKLKPAFMEYVVPSNVLYLFGEKDDKVLTLRDIENVKARTDQKGYIEGADLLLDLLSRYDNWFECLMKVLRDGKVKLDHAAAKMEEIKAQLDEETQCKAPYPLTQCEAHVSPPYPLDNKCGDMPCPDGCVEDKIPTQEVYGHNSTPYPIHNTMPAPGSPDVGFSHIARIHKISGDQYAMAELGSFSQMNLSAVSDDTLPSQGAMAEDMSATQPKQLLKRRVTEPDRHKRWKPPPVQRSLTCVDGNQVELRVSCDRVPKGAKGLQVSLYRMEELGILVGSTESLKVTARSPPPEFASSIKVLYNPQPRFLFHIKDQGLSTLASVETKLDKMELGGVVKFPMISKKKEELCNLIIYTEIIDNKGECVELEFQARNLDNKDMIGRSDPFLEIRRKTKNIQDDQWQVVHRTEVIMNNLNPTWAPFQISLQSLCQGDKNKEIKIKCYDYDSDGDNDYIGELTTTFTKMSQASAQPVEWPCINPAKTHKKGYKDSGTIQLKSCKITSAPGISEYCHRTDLA